MSNLKTVGKDTLIYGVGSVLQRFIGFFLLPFYTRALSPSEYGILDTLSTFVFFFSIIVNLGLEGATGRYFFIAETETEKGKVLYTSSIIRMIANVIPVLLTLPFCNQISTLLFDSDKYALVIGITLITIPLVNIQTLQSLLFRFYRELWKYTLVLVLNAILSPITGILFVVILSYGVLGAQLSTFISSLFIIVFSYFYYARKKYIREFSWIWAKKMLIFGYPLIFTGLLAWIYNVSDRFFLLHYSTLDEIGLYSIGSRFSSPILLINMALSMSLNVIAMSEYSKEKDNDKPLTKSLLTKTWYFYLSLAVTLATIISIFSFDLVGFVTTPEYIESILSIPFLIFSLILHQSLQMTGNGMTLKEKNIPYIFISAMGASINVGLNFYFIPKYGFVGAAATTLVANFASFIVAYFWSQKHFYIKRSIIKPILLLSIGFGISAIYPFLEIKYNIFLPIYLKLIVFILFIPLPFLLGLLKFSELFIVIQEQMKKFIKK